MKTPSVEVLSSNVEFAERTPSVGIPFQPCGGFGFRSSAAFALDGKSSFNVFSIASEQRGRRHCGLAPSRASFPRPFEMKNTSGQAVGDLFRMPPARIAIADARAMAIGADMCFFPGAAVTVEMKNFFTKENSAR